MPEPPPYSPGLEGVIAGETSLSLVDGERGRLLYRGYRIGDLVDPRHLPGGREPALDRRVGPAHRLPTGARSRPPVMTVLRALPATTKPMDALRTAVSAWGATQDLPWPPTVEQARALTSFSPSALAAFARLRAGQEPVEPDPVARPRRGVPLPAQRARDRTPATARALDAYFIVGAEHGFNASTFTARVVTSTRSDIASAVAGAIGTMKGPLHGGAPSEVVDQLSQIGSAEHAEAWVRDALDRGERLMGFGHRVYRAYDPRAAALRKVAEGDAEHRPDWLSWRSRSRTSSLRVLAEKHPERPLKTNVEYYAAPVLMGVGLTPDLFPATFSLARHAGWTAHILEQAADNRLIRPGRQLRRPRGARPAGLGRLEGRRIARRSRQEALRPRSATRVASLEPRLVAGPSMSCSEPLGRAS